MVRALLSPVLRDMLSLQIVGTRASCCYIHISDYCRLIFEYPRRLEVLNMHGFTAYYCMGSWAIDGSDFWQVMSEDESE